MLKAARAFDVTPLVVAVADSTAVTSLADLQAVVEELQREMVRLRAEIANLKAPQEVPDVVEERPKKEIINQVLAYYDAHPHQDLYPSDVAQALSLDAFSVYEITNQLVADGRLR